MRFSESGDNWVEITLPIKTFSEANGGAKKSFKFKGQSWTKSEHWTDRYKRHKRQKGMVGLTLRPFKNQLKIPCVITLTRFAPRKLDKFDNLPMSFKWILDAICEVITGDYRPGRADDTIEDDIDVIYKQVISKEYAVKIRIQMQN